LTFNVKSVASKTVISGLKQDSSFRSMPFGKTNTFTSNDVKVIIPVGALYDTLDFMFTESERYGKLLSPVYKIHNRYTPLQKAYNLSIKYDSIPFGKANKLLIVQLDDNRRMGYAGGTFSNGYITADLMSFGNFAISIDTIPPVISSNTVFQGSDLSGKNEIRVRITDNLSGIKSFTGIIDGKWSLFEYDPRYDLLVYKFDPDRITKGTKHILNLRVTDNKDNTGVFDCEFTW
jgi:hypothetical protein